MPELGQNQTDACGIAVNNTNVRQPDLSEKKSWKSEKLTKSSDNLSDKLFPICHKEIATF